MRAGRGSTPEAAPGTGRPKGGRTGCRGGGEGLLGGGSGLGRTKRGVPGTGAGLAQQGWSRGSRGGQQRGEAHEVQRRTSQHHVGGRGSPQRAVEGDLKCSGAAE